MRPMSREDRSGAPSPALLLGAAALAASALLAAGLWLIASTVGPSSPLFLAGVVLAASAGIGGIGILALAPRPQRDEAAARRRDLWR